MLYKVEVGILGVLCNIKNVPDARSFTSCRTIGVDPEMVNNPLLSSNDLVFKVEDCPATCKQRSRGHAWISPYQFGLTSRFMLDLRIVSGVLSILLSTESPVALYLLCGVASLTDETLLLFGDAQTVQLLNRRSPGRSFARRPVSKPDMRYHMYSHLKISEYRILLTVAVPVSVARFTVNIALSREPCMIAP